MGQRIRRARDREEEETTRLEGMMADVLMTIRRCIIYDGYNDMM